MHANGWNKAVVAFTGTVGDGNFTALWTPSRANSVFTWWYDAEVWWNKIEKWSTVVQDLYARFECNSGYIDLMDWNGCVKNEATLLPWPELNSKLKAVANDTSSYSLYASDYRIKHIV